MPIDGSKPLGDWGKMTPTNESGSQHITQTNSNSGQGSGAHVTTQTGGMSSRDNFDANGNHTNSTFKKP